jgi:hypothetical protein
MSLNLSANTNPELIPEPGPAETKPISLESPAIQKRLAEKYAELSLDEQEELHKLFHQTGPEVLNRYQKLKGLVFKKEPPTPEEFLDPANGWLPHSFTDSIFPHIKDDFIKALDPQKAHTQLVQYGGTRLGKSAWGALLIVYTIVYIHHLRDPQLYYGLSPTSSLVIYLLAFKFEKSKQLLLKPIFDILAISPRFHRVKFQDKVKPTQEEMGHDTIVYSTAATVGEITLASGLQLSLGNTNPLSIIGANVIQMYVSEIAFFIEHAGTSEEEIFRLYTDGLDRIKATVGERYLAFVYLDTSANNAESIIENYIIKVLPKQPKVFLRTRARWEARPKLFPKWLETGETFKVIRGNAKIPAQIVTKQAQLQGVPRDLVIDVPIDVKPEFERNLIKSIKDIAGLPTMPENKWLQDVSILDDFFRSEIPNVEGILTADAGERPEGLLWDQIQKTFFVKVPNMDSYQIRRAVREPRYIGLDLATSARGDIAGLAACHKEWDEEKKEVIYVMDFAFPIGPGDTGINVDAITMLIMDLSMKGRIYIQKAFVDRFQSETLRQNLNRAGIKTEINSVDVNIDHYQYLLSSLHTRTILCGRNIFAKNNLECLQTVKDKTGKEKVDHPVGKTQNRYFGDWGESKAGINAKDVSDAICQALAAARLDDHHPVTIKQEEDRRLSPVKKNALEQIGKAHQDLHRFY